MMRIAKGTHNTRIGWTAAVLGGLIVLSAFIFQFSVFSSQKPVGLKNSTDKLESSLQQMVENQAEGSIRIVIEAQPCQIAEVIERIGSIGVTVESSYENLIQVLAPVSLIPILAEDKGVKIVRLPLTPVEHGQSIP